MPYNEADTRAKLVDPALHGRGWTEDLIQREDTVGMREADGRGGEQKAKTRGRVDYLLAFKAVSEGDRCPMAYLEAKPEIAFAGAGLQQAKDYADFCDRFHVPFVFSTNGKQFKEYDRLSGITRGPLPMEQFPTPDDLRLRYEEARGFSVEAPEAKALFEKRCPSSHRRRYYQDAAVRAVLEKLLACAKKKEPRRALLSLATGTGKTFIAVELMWRLREAGQLKRALFLCDRDSLRTQAEVAFNRVFGNNAAAVLGGDPQKNARIVIATYQSLGLDKEGDGGFLRENYPPGYFSHIIIDECHRSAWNKWSEVLTHNEDAVHIGLTATPRRLKGKGAEEDEQITADNHKWFGEPVYSYGIAQGHADGYLAGILVRRSDILYAEHSTPERIGGIPEDVVRDGEVSTAHTLLPVPPEAIQGDVKPEQIDRAVRAPDRIRAVCEDLFRTLRQSRLGPKQKTIIFCTEDHVAEQVAGEMNNLYAQWLKGMGIEQSDDTYAFQCTGSADGNAKLPDFKGSGVSHFIATTVDLLSTGVDVPPVRNIVFLRYLKSPILFYQMIGRGTRIHDQTGKFDFWVHDYTNATRLFGEDFTSVRKTPPKESQGPPPGDEVEDVLVEGITVTISAGGVEIPVQVDGKDVLVSLEEYQAMVAAGVLKKARTLDHLREIWVNPDERRAFVEDLPLNGGGLEILRQFGRLEGCDDFDVVASVAYGQAPKTTEARAEAYEYKNREFLDQLGERKAGVMLAIASQYRKGGTEALEHLELFDTHEVQTAGGFDTVEEIDEPSKVVLGIKRKLLEP